jgi:hypothetical protein
VRPAAVSSRDQARLTRGGREVARKVLGVLLLTWAGFRLMRLLAAHAANASHLEQLASRWWPALLIVAAGGARTISSMTM